MNRRGYQIQIVRRSRPGQLSDRRMRRVVQGVLRQYEISSCSLEITILGVVAMAKLNQEWLGHEGPTDVITFDLGDVPALQARHVSGQIVICWPIARRQSAGRGHSAERELLLYVVHGLLHLLGHDDHDPKAAARMHRREDELLEALGIGCVYSSGGKMEEGAR